MALHLSSPTAADTFRNVERAEQMLSNLVIFYEQNTTTESLANQL
jgi:hypothetical protein